MWLSFLVVGNAFGLRCSFVDLISCDVWYILLVVLIEFDFGGE